MTAGIALAKLVVAIVLFLIFFLFIRNALTTAISGVNQQIQSRAAGAQRAPPAKPPSVVRSSQPAAPVTSIRACEELIDAASGTYIDHCTRRAPESQPVRRTPGETATSRRSAIDILSESTPDFEPLPGSSPQ